MYSKRIHILQYDYEQLICKNVLSITRRNGRKSLVNCVTHHYAHIWKGKNFFKIFIRNFKHWHQ